MGIKALFRKWENWILPAACLFILFLCTGIAYDCYFDLNDDVLIRDILSGAYTGEPEALTSQLLWPLGALLALLCRLLPQVPVFGLFLWLCQAGSLFLILKRSLYLAESFCGKLLLSLMETLAMAACLLYHLVFVQYTVTAGLLAAAAICWFLTGNGYGTQAAQARKGKSVSGFFLRNLPAILLLLLSFCLRSEMLLLLLPLAAVAGVWKWSEERPVFTLRNAAAYVGLFGLILASLLAAAAADGAASGSQAWREFSRLFDARTEIYDFYSPSLRSYEENREFYEGLGLTETECALLENYNYGADDAIDAEVMEKIAAYGKSVQGTMAHSLSEGVWLYAQRLRNNRAIVPDSQFPFLLLEAALSLFILAAAVRGRKELPEGKKGIGILWKLLLIGAVRSGLWLFLIMRERVPERISHPLYFCELVLLGWLLLDLLSHMPKRGTALRLAASCFFLAASVVFLAGGIGRTSQEYARREEVNAVNRAALSRYASREDLLYLADVMSTVDFSEKLFSIKNRLGNYDLLGGWMCKSPHSEKKLSAFGYETMGEAVQEGENVRFVGEPETDWSWLEDFLKERGISAELTLEEEISAEGRSLYVWRLERG